MSALSVLLLGIGLGMRHATDADHVVVITALVQREPGFWRAARIAALWGAGHTVTFLALGLMIVVLDVRPSQTFEHVTEVGVALMLIGIGIWHLVRQHARSEQTGTNVAGSTARPLLIGLVHGTSGSAGIALLAATTIDSRPLAVSYLLLVALGTVLGMVMLTALLARPIRWTIRRGGRVQKLVCIAAAWLSIALGVSVFVQST